MVRCGFFPGSLWGHRTLPANFYVFVFSLSKHQSLYWESQGKPLPQPSLLSALHRNISKGQTFSSYRSTLLFPVVCPPCPNISGTFSLLIANLSSWFCYPKIRIDTLDILSSVKMLSSALDSMRRKMFCATYQKDNTINWWGIIFPQTY